MTAPTLRPPCGQCKDSGTVAVRGWDDGPGQPPLYVVCACRRAPAAPTGEAGRDPFAGSNPYERTVNKPAPADERALQRWALTTHDSPSGQPYLARRDDGPWIRYADFASWQAAAQTRARFRCAGCGEFFDEPMPSGHPSMPDGEQCGPVVAYHATPPPEAPMGGE